ncbi:MAG: RNA methyltransferase [Myxococcales bacterium]|nr:RNA methyltransferase [Myxococcales bacterium]
MKPVAPLYMALLHHPVLDQQGEIITTAVTNLDIHDGGRLAATFGLLRYFLVTPIQEQRALVHRVRSHWVEGPGARKKSARHSAMALVEPIEDLQGVCDQIEEREGLRPLLLGTSARALPEQKISYEDAKGKLFQKEQPVVLLFGTGWGISRDIQPAIDLYLPPIYGPTEFNHLSVRSAMSITLDRLLGS